MEPPAQRIKLIKARVYKSFFVLIIFLPKQFPFQECGKTFDVYKKLYLHQRSHDRKNICPLDGCEKKFATKGDLEKHIRTHTGERPYQCEVCGKKFTQRGSLKGHRETVHASLPQEVIVN